MVAPKFLLAAALTIAGCASRDLEPRRYLKDAKSGELPLIALWTEPVGSPLLAIWSNGDVVWKNGLRPSMEPPKAGSLSKSEAERAVADIETSLARFEDKPTDPGLVDASSMVLAFRQGGETRWVTTYHSMRPDLPTTIRSRWTLMAVEYPERRAELEARIPANERDCVAAWDRVMASLSATLNAQTAAPQQPREIAWTELPSR